MNATYPIFRYVDRFSLIKVGKRVGLANAHNNPVHVPNFLPNCGILHRLLFVRGNGSELPPKVLAEIWIEGQVLETTLPRSRGLGSETRTSISASVLNRTECLGTRNNQKNNATYQFTAVKVVGMSDVIIKSLSARSEESGDDTVGSPEQPPGEWR